MHILEIKMDKANIEAKQKIAREKIISIHGTPEGEYGPTLFVSHHLEDMETSYWLDQFKNERPDAKQILDSLILVASWSSQEDGAIAEISMES